VFVALGICHAIRMRCITLSLCFVRMYSIFLRYVVNGKIFEKKNGFKCFFTLNLPGTFLILRRNERDMIKNFYLSLCKVLFIFVRF